MLFRKIFFIFTSSKLQDNDFQGFLNRIFSRGNIYRNFKRVRNSNIFKDI